MKESRKRLFDQVAQMAEEGAFGEAVKAGREEYSRLPNGIAAMLKCVTDAYRPDRGLDAEVAQIRGIFTQLLIAAYRDAARADQEVALALVHSMIADFPGVPESCLAPQFCSLLESALAFRELTGSTNRSLLWQQTCATVRAYNEFLNALFGYLVPCLQCAQGREADPKVFSMTYATRLGQLKSLTGGEEGAFYLLGRVARPDLRNAIAHSTIWLDAEKARVHYRTGGRQRRERQIDLIEFSAFAMIGSHLAEPYLAAMGTIVVMEDGSELAKSLLPAHLRRVFTFRKDGA